MTDKPVDLSPTNLMGKPLVPNYGLKHAAQTLKGADIQIHHKPNAGLRSKQNAAVRMFIEDQRTALYLQSRKGTINEDEYNARTNELNRIRDEMIQSMSEWAGIIDPKVGARGTDISSEFLRACGSAFGQLKDASDARIEISIVPTGPVSRQETEEIPTEPAVVPSNFSISDLVAVEQPTNSGPLHEVSVVDSEGKAIRPELDLPVFEPASGAVEDEFFDDGLKNVVAETEEDSGVHPVRSDEVSPPEGGDNIV